MIRQSFAIPVDAPPDRVFGWLTDAGNQTRWDSTVISITASAEVWRKGTTLMEIRRFGANEVELHSIVAELEQDASFTVRSLSGDHVESRWELKRDGMGGTRLRYEREIGATGLGRLVQALNAGKLKRRTEHDFRHLPALIEVDVR